MKISTRIAAIGAAAALGLSAFAGPASAVSSSDELSDRFDWVLCPAVEVSLAALDLPEDGMRNNQLASALEERGQDLSKLDPRVGEWNAQAAADYADRAQKCKLVEPNTPIENASSNLNDFFAGLSS